MAICNMPFGDCEPIFVDTYTPPLAPEDPSTEEQSLPSILRNILEYLGVPLTIGAYLADTWRSYVVTMYALPGCDAYEGTRLGLSHKGLKRAYDLAAMDGHGNSVPIFYDRIDWELEVKARGFKSWKEQGECSTFPEFR